MRKLFLAIVTLFLPMGAHAACDPTTATAGMLGCSPTAPSAAGTDYLYLWQPNLFPNAQHKITVDSLFAGRGAPNLSAPGPIGGTTPNTGAFTTITGDTSAATSTATGSTTARTNAARFAERVNVRDYGAVCDNVTDDSAAFIAAINRVNTIQVAGATTVIYVPPGKCLIKGTHGALPMFSQNTMGGVIGEGPQRSWIIMDATYTGDLFSWSTSWLNGDFPNPLVPPADTVRTASVKTGPLVRGLSIVGNRAASGTQYGLHFYDRNDFVRVENVDLFYIKGGAISSGAVTAGGTASGMRESSFSNVRIYNSGDTGIPAFGFTAVGSAGGTPIKFTDIDIYGSYGPGLSIRNNGSNPVGGYFFSKLRVEGLEGNPPGVAADNIVIGDASETGAISNIDMKQVNLLSPYSGFCALRVTGSSAPTRPTNIYFDGSIQSGGTSLGKGLCLDAMRNGIFRIPLLTSTDSNYTIGPLVSTGITLDLNGAGPATVTSSVDAAATGFIQTPTFTTGDLVAQKMRFGLTPHDGSVSGGNGLGVGAVDLQMIRGQAAHAATSPDTVIGGGIDNQASAAACTIAGGNVNLCTGQFSAVPGGSNAADNGRQALFAFAMGRFAANGDAQLASAVMRGSGSGNTAFRLTSGGAAANNLGGTQNCFNIPNNFGFGFRAHLHARNFTTPGVDYDWMVPTAMVIRDTGVASTVVTLGTPVILSRGTVTGAAVTVTADVTNGCLDVEFTPPTANTTDTWHGIMRIDSAEVQ